MLARLELREDQHVRRRPQPAPGVALLEHRARAPPCRPASRRRARDPVRARATISTARRTFRADGWSFEPKFEKREHRRPAARRRTGARDSAVRIAISASSSAVGIDVDRGVGEEEHPVLEDQHVARPRPAARPGRVPMHLERRPDRLRIVLGQPGDQAVGVARPRPSWRRSSCASRISLRASAQGDAVAPAQLVEPRGIGLEAVRVLGLEDRDRPLVEVEPLEHRRRSRSRRARRIGWAIPSSTRIFAARRIFSCSPSGKTTRLGSRRARSRTSRISSRRREISVSSWRW